MGDFINSNIQHAYNSNGNKHAINLNHDALYKDFDDEIWYELDGELKGVFLSNYGKYYTKKVNKSYGTLHENRYAFFKRIDNKKNTKIFLIDEQLLIKLVGPRPSKLHEVYHIDGNNKNNHINNLQWIEKKNKDYSNISNKTKSMEILQIQNNKIIEIFNSVKNASEKLGINIGQISDCAKGKRLSAKSFQWVYRKDLYDPDLDNEEWKLHITLNVYVSNMGRILLQNGKTQGEYDITKNSYKSSQLKMYIHRIVAETFIENPDPDNFNEIDHINGNCNNNKVENLRWCNRNLQILNRGHKYDINFDDTDYIKLQIDDLLSNKNTYFYQNILNDILKKYDNINNYLSYIYKQNIENNNIDINVNIDKKSNSSKQIILIDNETNLIFKVFGSKKECAEYLNISTSTLNNYIKLNKLINKKYIIRS